jgi:hypothetical protein
MELQPLRLARTPKALPQPRLALPENLAMAPLSRRCRTTRSPLVISAHILSSVEPWTAQLCRTCRLIPGLSTRSDLSLEVRLLLAPGHPSDPATCLHHSPQALPWRKRLQLGLEIRDRDLLSHRILKSLAPCPSTDLMALVEMLDLHLLDLVRLRLPLWPWMRPLDCSLHPSLPIRLLNLPWRP